ncbi:unnamed protein product [Hymenolepis diminuta]|uniref:Uncharacterized protein n=1 Tax=Hymenolepis diminuta TaxID=6216 RepID=A0A564YFN0_HYMDI|nr:unnamed protein product [Hymenolepis diminuta]
MLSPTDVKTLNLFLGSTSCYNSFLSSLRDIRALFNCSLQKDTAWYRSVECRRAFEKLKSVVLSNMSLTRYNSQSLIVWRTSIKSFQLRLMQKWLHKQPLF